jgi:murein hydrolase activator
MSRTRFATIGVIVFVSSVLLAQTSVSERTAMERARGRIRALQDEADRLARQSRTVLGDLRRLELEQQINREALATSNAELTRINAALEKARTRVAVLEARRLDATPALAAELVEIYKRGRRRHAQLLLSNVTDSRTLGRMVRNVVALADAEQSRVDTHRKTLSAEREAVADLEKRMAEAAATRAAQTAARAALQRSLAERSRLIDDIDRKRDVAAKYAGELQAAQTELERTLADLSSGSTVRTGLPIIPFKGDLEWPVRGTLQRRFAAGGTGANRSASGIVRNGIEVTATEGSVVRVVHGGKVTYAAPFIGLGTLVVVDHGNGVQSLYGHLANMAVGTGDMLDRGDRVGLVGPEALYFELRVDGRPVDPLQWLRSSP